ncbi:MAG: nuclear transport factor 2 family protein [bacterium]
MFKKNLIMFILVLIAGVVTMAFNTLSNENDTAVDEVRSLVEAAYLNGAFNDLDTESMRTGFHRKFAIFSAQGEELRKYPIKSWIAGIEKRKAQEDFDPNSQKWDYEFKYIDVTGGSAAVKIELYKKSQLIYTDYLSLLKFESGWKIVAKVYHKHVD